MALRRLAHRPGYSAVVIATLAFGIAATTLTFSLVSASLLRPPPFETPDQLAIVYRTATTDLGSRNTRWSYPRTRELFSAARSFEALATFGRAELNLAGGGDPERVSAEIVSAPYFGLLRAQPALGRFFSASEDSTPGSHPVVVLSADLWERRFGRDPAVVGRSIQLNGEPLVVIGVARPGFDGLTGQTDLWVPLMMAPRVSYPEYLTTDQNFISVVGRLRESVSLAAARAELSVLGANIARAIPDTDEDPAEWAATAVPLQEVRVDRGNRRALLLLLGAVGFLLLLACLNLAGLGVARSLAQRQELAVRLALGAGRPRLIGEMMAESALLGLFGASLGVLLAAFLVRVVRVPGVTASGGNMYGAVGNFAGATIDSRVLLFAVGASVLAVLVAGLVPALSASKADPGAELKTRSESARPSRRRLQAGLVMAQVALAMVLAVGGGLLLVSLRRAQQLPLGIEPEPVLTFRIQPSEVRYPAAAAPALIDQVLEAINRVPGVVASTVDGCAPLGASCGYSSLSIVGRPPVAGDAGTYRHYVGPDHFSTLGVRLIEGRVFEDRDGPDQPGVAVINQEAARRFFPGENPVGQRIWFGSGRFDRPERAATIVGVVDNVPYGGLQQGAEPSVYTPYRQFTYAGRMVMVRVAGDPMAHAEAIRRAVATVDATPTFDVRPLTDRLGDAWSRTKFLAQLMSAFALAALCLAGLGVYAVISHSVNERTRELGIRTALGATSGRLVRLVVAEGLTMTTWGVVLGAAAALGLGRVLRSQLFGVDPTNPVMIVTLGAVLLGAAAAASYLPATRATNADPLVALRGSQ